MARSYLFNCTSLLALLCGRVAAQDLSVKKTCHVASSNGTADDSPAIAAAFEMCGTNGTVAFAEGVNYNVLTPLHASGLSEVTIQMFGNLLLPTNLTYVQALYNATIGDSGDNFYWLSFEGSQVRYIGTPNVTTGWIQSFGQAWWDANPQNGTGVDGRPHLSLWNTTDSTIDHLKSLKPIAWNHRLTGSNITVTNAIIDAYSTGGFPFNTDGFQCAGTDITITDSVIYNGDDAIAINSGAHNVNVRRLTFGYQSHGMSIGSLGKNAASYSNVSNIFFDDITVVSALYAARFKSWIGGQGLARNITWQNVRLYNVTFPIYVTQTYIDQSSSTGERPNNSTVEIQVSRLRSSPGIGLSNLC